ncbi:MAG: hypothetical protein V4671_07910 [Armatimonadota bacterium]
MQNENEWDDICAALETLVALGLVVEVIPGSFRLSDDTEDATAVYRHDSKTT